MRWCISNKIIAGLLTLLISHDIDAQNKTGEINSVSGFSKSNEAAGYYLEKENIYIITQQDGKDINRLMYDTAFSLLQSYSYKTGDISFNRNHNSRPVFATEIQLNKGYYEVFADRNSLLLIRPDFSLKKDSIYFTLELSTFEQDEKRLAIMPFSKGIRVLTYLKKKKKLRLYEWQENGTRDSADLALPESSLSDEEIRLYTKDARVKYKDAFDDMFVCKADGENIIASAGTNSIYYSENKAWVFSQTPFYTGYNILEIDFGKRSLESHNIMVNDMRKNNTASPGNIFHLYAAVIGNYIFIRNTSQYFFEYHIYDLQTRKKLKEYISEDNESLRKTIHSDLNQRGTWLSANDDKKLDKEKAFLRKVNLGRGFIALSQNSPDSFTITTGSLIETKGLGGLIVALTTGVMGYMANITIGNFQIIPYLDIYRNKLIYCHSRFSKTTLEPSASQKVSTTLDQLLDNFERRDLRSGSSFLLKKNGRILAAVFNTDSKKFDLYNLSNEQGN